MRCAGVILRDSVRQTDNVYTYLVPEDLKEKITTGSYVNVPFGRGDRTKAAIVVSVSDEEKGLWFRELLAVQEEIAAERCASMVGKVEKVLVEEKAKKDGRLCGRTSGNIIVEFDGDDSLIGDFHNVRITEARNWILNGELI